MRMLLALIVLSLSTSVLAGPPAATLVWQFKVVGTPGFLGPPKITDAQYTAPVPLNVNKADTVPCTFEEAMGNFEAFISASGHVESVHSRHEPVPGNECQSKHVFPIISGWRFKPASFEGRPIPVYLSVWVENQAWSEK
jgi:hypothetical protein